MHIFREFDRKISECETALATSFSVGYLRENELRHESDCLKEKQQRSLYKRPLSYSLMNSKISHLYLTAAKIKAWIRNGYLGECRIGSPSPNHDKSYQWGSRLEGRGYLAALNNFKLFFNIF